MSSKSVSATEKVTGTDVKHNGVLKVGDAKFDAEAFHPSADGGQHPKGFRLAMVVLALVLSVFLVALDLVNGATSHLESYSNTSQTIIATAIPRITDQFHSLDQIR
jgi:hypothetical protein